MLFDAIPASSQVVLDANAFLFFFTPDPQFGPPCQRLFERIELKDVTGITSTHVVAEVAHRAMTIEAIQQYGYPSKGIAQRLRGRPSDVQKLARFRQLIEYIFQIGTQVLTVTPRLLHNAAEVSQQTGLLTNDALLVAIMQEHGLTNLASHDADFDRVPGLNRYAPA